MIRGNEEDAWDLKLFEHRHGTAVVVVTVVERDQRVLAIGVKALEQIVGADEAVAVLEIVLDELAELVHGGALQRIDEIAGDFLFVGEQ